MTLAVAADTSVRVSRALFNLAADLTKSTPLAWGRYFNGFHTTSAEYKPQEAGLFEGLGLRLLPVAQQTPKVAGSALDGAANAALNVYKFIERIGLDHLAANGTEYLMFLDVEGDQQGNPSLSAAYYTGWSQMLVTASRDQSNRRFTILPAVYGRTKDAQTWQALRDAEANGAEPCRGVWVTRQHFDACTKPRPDWETTFLTPDVPLSCPVYVWQYAIDCPTGDGVDVDLLNPDDALRQELLRRLIVPAAA